MKNYFFIILFSLSVNGICAQDLSRHQKDSIINYYNVGYYSQALNLKLDTVANPQLFAAADEWLGTTYHYGGDDMRGIDCSHFSSMLYNYGYGFMLGNSAHAIHKSVKMLVAKQDLKEGDLVFFKIGRSNIISHVGVYLGNNKFVHATTQAGVILSDLSEPYYKKWFVTGGRMHQFILNRKNITASGIE